MNYQSLSMKDGIIFVIDTGSIALSESFSCKLSKIFKIIREKISYTCLTSDNSEEICILLVNTLKSSAYTENIASMYEFASMESANSSIVKKLDNLLNSDDFRSTLLEQTSGFGTVSLKELFCKCNKLLNFCKSYRKKSIIFITPNYNHFENIEEQLFLNLKMIINDIKKNNVNVNIIIVDENSIVNASSWIRLGVEIDLCDNLNNLLLMLNQKCSRPKCHKDILLYLTENFYINVDLYSMVDIKENPKGFHVDAVTNQIIKCEQVFKFSDEDEIFKNHNDFLNNDEYKNENIFLKMNFYGKKFEFTEGEVANIRKIIPPGIKILGFRRMNDFDLNYMFSTTTFVSANEKSFSDKRIFFNLFNSCVKKNVFIVGKYNLKSNFAPQLISLIPTNNLKREHFNHEGFYLIKMPFKENIRKVYKIDTSSNINSDVDDKFFIDKLTSNFTPFHYGDPMLAKHYRGVEALALEQKTTEIKKSFNCLNPYANNKNLMDKEEDELNIFNSN